MKEQGQRRRRECGCAVTRGGCAVPRVAAVWSPDLWGAPVGRGRTVDMAGQDTWTTAVVLSALCTTALDCVTCGTRTARRGLEL